MRRPFFWLAASLVWGALAAPAFGVVNPFLWNATTNDPGVDEPPGLGTGYVVSSRNLGTDTVEDAFGNQDGVDEPETFIFGDDGGPDNGNQVLGDGETVDYIEWQTTSPVVVVGYRVVLTHPDIYGHDTELVRFLVDGVQRDFFDNDSQTAPNEVERLFAGGAVAGSTFRIELTRGQINGPRIWEIDALTEGFCGNEVVEPPEQCDDGNTEPGDGCDEMCQLEGGELDGPVGSVTALYDCEGAIDGAFSQGGASAGSGILYDFPDGPGGNAARASLGYTVVFSATATLDNLAFIALPGSATAGNCLVGGSVSLTHPLTFTSTAGGPVTDTVTVALEAILDGWQAHVPLAAPAGSDTRFGFDVSLGGVVITDTLTLDAGGLQIDAQPGAFTVDPLPGGGVSVGGTLAITETLSTSSPAIVELFAEQFAFAPAATQGISITNTLARAFRYRVVSLSPGIEVRSLGVPIPEPSAPLLTVVGAVVLLLARRWMAAG
jgi:cysteine-rich repeat protein